MPVNKIYKRKIYNIIVQCVSNFFRIDLYMGSACCCCFEPKHKKDSRRGSQVSGRQDSFIEQKEQFLPRSNDDENKMTSTTYDQAP